MHSVYFPFTYVSEDTAKKLFSCFPNTVVFQAITLPDRGSYPGIEYQTPVTGDEEKIQNASGEYKSWAQLHQGSKLSSFKTRMGDVPFYNETSIASIRTDIKNRIQGNASPAKDQKASPKTSQFAARLFLAIAHEHDSAQSQIQKELAAVEQMEEKLFNDLKGSKEDSDDASLFSSSGQHPAPEANREALIDQRLHAWAQLAIAQSDFSCLYVTSSKTVLDSLIELGLLDEEPMWVLKDIPILNNDNALDWKQALMDQLESCAVTDTIPSNDQALPKPSDSPTDARATLTIHAATHIPPEMFFHRLSAKEDTDPNNRNEGAHQHTLICLIE